jgi:hypothetical protein
MFRSAPLTSIGSQTDTGRESSIAFTQVPPEKYASIILDSISGDSP